MNDSNSLLFISTFSVEAGSVLDSVKILTGLTKNIELTGGNNYDEYLQDELLKIKKEKDISFLVHSYFLPPKIILYLTLQIQVNVQGDLLRTPWHM